jgi:hypothetical protein
MRDANFRNDLTANRDGVAAKHGIERGLRGCPQLKG